MTSRAAALSLTLLLLAAGAFAGPPPCCPSSRLADQTMIAMDCCSSMVDCPTRLQAPATIVVRGVDFSPAAGILLAVPARPLDSAYDPRRPASSHGFLDTSPHQPPLYRLHAQLLI